MLLQFNYVCKGSIFFMTTIIYRWLMQLDLDFQKKIF